MLMICPAHCSRSTRPLSLIPAFAARPPRRARSGVCQQPGSPSRPRGARSKLTCKTISAPQMCKMMLICASDAVRLSTQAGARFAPRMNPNLTLSDANFGSQTGVSHANCYSVFIRPSKRRDTSCPSKGTAGTHRIGIQPARMPQRLGGIYCCRGETAGTLVLREGSQSTIEIEHVSEPLRVHSMLGHKAQR